jgi:hypothetical protein
MLKSAILAATLLAVFFAVPTLAGDCNNDKFPGTYTRVDAPTDVLGDGVLHQYVYQLVLNSDGSAIQYWTGLPDYQTSAGTGSINIGSWKCRNDGKLVVSLLAATYEPVAADPNVGIVDDVRLLRHTVTTLLLKVNNPNTLTRIQARNRNYAAGDDPTDSAGGTLSALTTTQVTYKRFVASDADLTAP